MPITSGDIRLVKSKVMLDVLEGGGGPTGTVIPDGVSNAIFQDVSELDRVNGRVNARQVHVHVNTPDNEQYLGSNMIVANPPSDPNISVTLVDTGETFDTRADAIARIEAYLFVGASWPGYLFGNHITGMQTVTILQRSEVTPAIGDALVLTKRQGYSDEYRQYIRVIDVGVVLRTFEDTAGVYERYEVTLSLSDSLRADFQGFEASRYEIDAGSLNLKTRINDTVVANAARYYGVAALAEDAGIGDFSAKVESIYTQLVPSAQVETPVADARANQVSAALIAAGSTVTLSINATWTTTNALFIGGGILPGSLTVTRSGVVVTDEGGKLMSAAAQVGTLDYEDGVLTLSSNVYGGSGGVHAVVYTPAAVPATVSQSQGFDVTVPNRALNYIRTIEPPPVRGSLSISYMVQGNWITVRDDGSGAIRGSDAAFGAGAVNFTTGTVAVTLGALPDVGSKIIFQWVDPKTDTDNATLVVDNGSKFYWPINANGVATEDPASVGIAPLGLEITWDDGVATRTVTDDGEGNLTGYGTGKVDYARGTVKMSPTTVPPWGTQVTITRDAYARVTATPSVSFVGATMLFDLATAVDPGSVYFQISGQLTFKYQGGAVTNMGAPRTYAFLDRGDGILLMLLSKSTDDAYVLEVGTIDYPSGTCVVDTATVLSADQARIVSAFDNFYSFVPAVSGGLLGSR